MRFKLQLESTLHGTSGVGRLYFSTGPVRSVVAHSLPARFESLIVRASCTSLHDCIVSMQALAFAGSFHFALYKVRPTTEPIAMLDHRIANAGSASWVV